MRIGSSRILLIAFCSTFFTNLATAADRKPADDAYAVIAGDSRGEFAFRVPPGPMKYTVRAKAAGFEQDEKILSISGDERVDVFFALKQASGK